MQEMKMATFSTPAGRAGAVLTITLFATAAQAAGKVEVSFKNINEFSDAGQGVIERERNTKSLGDFMQGWGTVLPDGQTLQLEVLDVDLAGELRHNWRGLGQDVRVLRGRADAPHIKLRYSLQAAGQTIKSGETQLADLNYFFGTPPHSSLGDLPFEKRMLQQWFIRNFNAASP
jgi:Protein of unknown function (DUF3016)